MKKICLFLFLYSYTSSFAQITFEFKVDSTFYGYLFFPTKISDSETKYVSLDTVADNFSLYNLDLTPFKLNIPVPFSLRNGDGFNVWFYSVMYITRSLFDCDTSNIEFLYSAQNYPFQPLWVMREDGTVLFYSDSARTPYCLGCPGGTNMLRPILQTEMGAKLLIMEDFPTSTGGRNISFYSLCGTLPNGVEQRDLVDEENANQYVTVFPNPSLNQVTFDFNLPDNINDYELVIVDNNAKELKREKVNFQKRNFNFDVSHLSTGTYYFSLVTKNKSYQSGKFIVTR